MLTELAKIAGIIGLLGYIPYILAIIRKKTTPNPATWWIWSVVGWAAFTSYYAAGEHETFWLMLTYAVGPSIVGILSFKYGKVDALEKFDIICLVISFFSIVLWQITNIPLLALTINLGIDITGALPTLRKTYFEPDSEDALSWSVFWTGNTLNFGVILVSGQWNAASIPYPLYLSLLASSMMGLILGGRSPKRIRKRTTIIATDEIY
ncbi:MAG: hypothetical protein AB8B99_13460 [Phormidesmis sp.]